MKYNNETKDDTMGILDLIEYYIDYINDGLKNDSYKKVCEGFEHVCSNISDNMVICIAIHAVNNVCYYTIMKTRYEGLYTFSSGNKYTMQTSESFAQWLYYHSSTHSIELKFSYRGDSK